jgi:hypothetical protein
MNCEQENDSTQATSCLPGSYYMQYLQQFLIYMWLILRNYGKPFAFHHLCINKMPNQACWMKGQPLIYLQRLVEDCSNTYDNQTFVINKICKRKGKNLQI